MAATITPENMPILYLAAKDLCKTCEHKDECDAGFRDEHLKVEILQSFESSTIFYAGYHCTGNRKNNVPYNRGFPEQIFFPHTERLENYYDVHPL